jgi:hypothetical protein
MHAVIWSLVWGHGQGQVVHMLISWSVASSHACCIALSQRRSDPISAPLILRCGAMMAQKPWHLCPWSPCSVEKKEWTVWPARLLHSVALASADRRDMPVLWFRADLSGSINIESIRLSLTIAISFKNCSKYWNARESKIVGYIDTWNRLLKVWYNCGWNIPGMCVLWQHEQQHLMALITSH